MMLIFNGISWDFYAELIGFYDDFDRDLTNKNDQTQGIIMGITLWLFNMAI